MASDFFISIDSTTPITKDQMIQYNIVSTSLTYILNGEEKQDDFTDELEKAKFYDKLREEGAVASSKGVSPKHFMDSWKPILDQGKDVLHLSLSSGVSRAFESAGLAADALNAVYPDRIKVVDTLIGGRCVTAMAVEAAKLGQQGKTTAEVAAWLEEEKYYYNMMFCVDDITHAKDKGIINAFRATVGNAIGLKPVLYAAPTGVVEMLMITRGLKNAFAIAVDVINAVKTDATTWVSVGHAGDEYNALMMVEMIRNEIPQVSHTDVNVLSPVLGINGGPGLVAVYFKGKNRNILREYAQNLKKNK